MNTPEETLDLIVQGIRRMLMHAGNSLAMDEDPAIQLEATLINLENLLRFAVARMAGEVPVLIFQRSTAIGAPDGEPAG
jgi:hypothetical protein